MEKLLRTRADIALHVERMRELLKEEYGYDFSFVVLARGRLVAANNAADGIIIATPRNAVTQ